MNDDILKTLSVIFPCELGELSSFSKVCSNLEDEEAVQSTAPFFGIWWEDVAPERWRAQPSALTFFTPQAMRYYLPSLIKCSVESPENTELAVYGLIWELGKASTCDDPWHDRRWLPFSHKQIEVVKIWLQRLMGTESAEFDKRIMTAMKTLQKLQEQKQN